MGPKVFTEIVMGIAPGSVVPGAKRDCEFIRTFLSEAALAYMRCFN